MPFSFELGTSSCNNFYFKEYTVAVTKSGVTVLSPAWLTLDSHQTSPSLSVNSSDPDHHGTYLVTVSTRLYAEEPLKSFTFQIWMTPCSITPVSDLGKIFEYIGS
jgi:hypothetical protein